MNPKPKFQQIIKQAAEADSGPVKPEADVDLSISLEDHKIEFRLECLREELGHLRDNHGLRLEYTGKIYWLVVGWLACVVIVSIR